MTLEELEALAKEHGLTVEAYGGNTGNAWFHITKAPNQVLIGTNPARVLLFGWGGNAFFEATATNVVAIFEQWEHDK